MHAPSRPHRKHSITRLQRRFLTLLPKIETHGRIASRHLRCPQQRDDFIAEMVALAWLWFVRLARRDKDAAAFVTRLATFAASAVRSGRRLAGTERARDVLSPLAQRRHGFTVSRLPDHSALNGNPLDEALHDNTQTPVPEQAAFRSDFPSWRRRRSRRDRRLIDAMMIGERTLAVAKQFGLSPGRVSQLRRQLHDDWRRFCGDKPDPSSSDLA